MSKSKREIEQEMNRQAAMPEARPYVGGRESQRDFPRRSRMQERIDQIAEERDRYQGGRGSTGYGGQGRLGGGPYGAERRGAADYGWRGDEDRWRYESGQRSDLPNMEDRPSYSYERRREDDRWREGRAWDREREDREFYERRREGDASRYYDQGRTYREDPFRERGDRRLVRSEYGSLRCRDIMTRSVTTCSTQTTLREVADKMEDENVGSIPVIDNGRLVGIVTDRDIVCRVIAEGRDTRSTLAAEAMSENLVTCGPDATITEAIYRMGEHQVRRLPIVDAGGRLVGIVSMADVALEAERDQELAHALEEISRPAQPRSHWT
jgi:CBS domain-containing protein